MWFMLFFGLAEGIFMSAEFKFFNGAYLPDAVLDLAGQLGFIFRACGSLGFGALSDRIGFKRTYFIVMVLQLIVCFQVVSTRRSSFAYIANVSISLACGGAHFSLFPALCAKVFGKVNGGLIFTFIFIAGPLSGNVIVFVYKSLETPTTIFYVLIGTTVFNMILLFFFDP